MCKKSEVLKFSADLKNATLEDVKDYLSLFTVEVQVCETSSPQYIQLVNRLERKGVLKFLHTEGPEFQDRNERYV